MQGNVGWFTKWKVAEVIAVVVEVVVTVVQTCIWVHSMPRAGSAIRRRDIESGHSRDMFILSSCRDVDDIADR